MKRTIIILFGITLVLIFFAVFSRFCTNRLYLLTEGGYFIPEESSVFRFEPTKWNEGSGEWWLYGEDDKYYYGLNVEPDYSPRYFILEKGKEPEKFDRFNYQTWQIERTEIATALDEFFSTIFVNDNEAALPDAQGETGNNALNDGIMTMTTAAEEVRIVLHGSSAKATIDWGDGSEPEQVEVGEILVRKFSNVNRIITITGKNIMSLDCSRNQLTSLDVSQNAALVGLECYQNKLLTLNVSKNTALKYLLCDKNLLTALDLSRNTALIELYCGNNQLTELDVSQNTALETLSCSENQLTALDVSNIKTLANLMCWNNELTALDVSQNTALQSLSCQNNNLKAQALNNLFETLHENDFRKSIYIFDNPGYEDCDTSIAERKGWLINRRY